MRKIILLAALVLVSSGCRKGPPKDQLKQSVQDRLDTEFQANLFEVLELKRRGSHPYTVEGVDKDFVLIYFDARLAFKKDYKLSDWDRLNVGSLVSVLGSKPQGVEGVNPEGNQVDDRLAVHGTAAFVKEGDGWIATMYVPEEEVASDGEVAEDRPVWEQRLDELRELAVQFGREKGGESLAALEVELAAAVAVGRQRLGKARNWLTFATGARGGEYHALGAGLEATLKKAGHKARAFASSGSVENVRLVDSQQVLFAFVQNDVAYQALNGTGSFQDRLPATNLAALCSLYPEAVHVLVRADAGIGRVGELAGKRVDLGLPGSGVRSNALQLLKAAAVPVEKLGLAQGASLETAAQALEKGQLDAVFFTGAYPTREVARLLQNPQIRLLGLDEELLASLKRQYPFLIPLTISGKTYPGQEHDCATVGVTAMLVTHKDTADEKVALVLKHLFENVSTLAAEAVQAYYISPSTAATGVSIPLHRAATR
jgi:TRAP transporter TAXI family solute receptor